MVDFPAGGVAVRTKMVVECSRSTPCGPKTEMSSMTYGERRESKRESKRGKQKGTFYFTRDLAAISLRSCHEHPEHPEVVLFTMSSTGAMAAVMSSTRMATSPPL